MYVYKFACIYAFPLARARLFAHFVYFLGMCKRKFFVCLSEIAVKNAHAPHSTNACSIYVCIYHIFE